MRLLTVAFLIASLSGSEVLAQSPRAVVVLPQAARWLDTQYQLYGPQEFVGCMIGTIARDTVWVAQIASPDMRLEKTRLANSNGTPAVRILKSCEASGWAHTVGEVHSHPAGTVCTWYPIEDHDPGHAFNGDVRSFLHDAARYEVSMIFCGTKFQWIARDLRERTVSFKDMDR